MTFLKSFLDYKTTSKAKILYYVFHLFQMRVIKVLAEISLVYHINLERVLIFLAYSVHIINWCSQIMYFFFCFHFCFCFCFLVLLSLRMEVSSSVWIFMKSAKAYLKKESELRMKAINCFQYNHCKHEKITIL